MRRERVAHVLPRVARAIGGLVVLGSLAGCGTVWDTPWVGHHDADLPALTAQANAAREAGALACAPREFAAAEIYLQAARLKANAPQAEDFHEYRLLAQRELTAATAKLKGCATAGGEVRSAAPKEVVREVVREVPVVREVVREVTREVVKALQIPHAEVYFDSGSARLRPEALAAITANARWLAANPASLKVILEGHTDGGGSDVSNRTLATRRAEAARDALVKAGIDRSRIQTVSYGAARPWLPGQSEAAWRWNRRVYFRLWLP